MLTQIKGLHHVTSMAADAQENNDFFTKTLGLRRVKKTVNFDAPDVYHLYYGDENGSAGTVMTYFPFPHIAKGNRGAGEVSETVFSVPKGSLGYWKERFAGKGLVGLAGDEAFGERRLRFLGPDGDGFALAEVDGDRRLPFAGGPVPGDDGVHGFHGVTMRLRDGGATGELLTFMGYEEIDRRGDLTRYAVKDGNGADFIDLEVLPGAPAARQGAGSVHHVAFAVEDRAAQAEVRKALMDTGYQVTPVIDRDYFFAIYFRTPGGVLFEVATNEPGFNRDEDTAHLGEALKLPRQHAHLRERIEEILPPIVD
ncbi:MULTISPECIES: ring-cleaving dioxygenase [unclassified Shinella]|jgi:glyoxalase family protein|uniref:ring-cleaving dioxygenase n=1 Tax=unclassified Shinella TaxID=2643062 RepID=UPI0003C5511F|nr:MULTISPECIES: ring-cleaving dioxygenase [unclassified Shinella]MCA0338292.1 ring-cleaving dioxygenase [Pseudomonadota bacterium]EYR84520.1 putative ring-cleaving dioxygenase MhqO [Shinella sp. DD12]MCO5148934.1 ring-cleaving dioxygenase [Shinella sp.]MDC7264992.1 ring-cleaving dioxygenase [Shinella sp. HY16]MDC7271889.1 ring-cleaving dioxygenase [Shinella sp. YZ44]